ncbi:glycosyltransferase [Dyadobacter crusticola]|uniref:glycosyltransferase n=1 Tax=Dyadobacter crusticola TaxID=292407 RepID=UPI0004E243BD|nr:glycosyltransferase [Dyadobacter crusticola]
MKILHITCFDNGGAGTAAVRLHKGLLNLGIESKVLVLEKRTDTPEVYAFQQTNKYFVLFQRILKNLGFPLTLEHSNDNRSRKFKGDFDYFSFAKTSFTELVNHPLVEECDVVNLHWVANFLDYQTFFNKINKPVVWTQHDMNAFQGGFHYKDDDIRNREILFEANDEQYQCKLKALNQLPDDALTVVSPSRWMMKEASESEILGRFSHTVIPNGIDTSVFNNKNSAESNLKSKLGLNPDKITVLFVSESVANPRKGFDFIASLTADQLLRQSCEFVAVGNIKSGQKLPGVKYLGSIHSEMLLSEIYSAADFFLLPSREDNLPNVMLESLACGTPVVAFSVGGMKDHIVNGYNGMLSNELSGRGLREVLAKCINRTAEFNQDTISTESRKKFSLERQAKSYVALYKKMTQILVD